MLRVYIDNNNGVFLRCPECSHVLLLAGERRGKLVVDYWWNPIRFPAGSRALLVCAGYQCDYQEEVEVAGAPADAVPLNRVHAYWTCKEEHPDDLSTPNALAALLDRLRRLYEATGRRKLISAIRQWEIERLHQVQQIDEYVAKSAQEGCELHLRTAAGSYVGRVLADFPGCFLLERTETPEGATVMLDKGELSSISYIMRSPGHEDGPSFGDGRWPGFHCTQQVLHSRFVVIGGQEVNLARVSERGLCFVYTPDPRAARALGFYSPHTRRFHHGAFPVAMVERHYEKRWFYRAGGERMELLALTTDPQVLVLKTRDAEVARRFGLRAEPRFLGTSERPRYWYGYFRLGELSTPEVQLVELPLPEVRRKIRRKS